MKTGQIDKLKTTVIDNDSLAAARLVPNKHLNVKLIVNGEITKPFTVNLQGASAAAVKAIESKGGKFNLTAQIGKDKLVKS